jgi:hypothetical protein
MVSALRAVDSVFNLHLFHATAKTAYLKSIKLKATVNQCTHLAHMDGRSMVDRWCFQTIQDRPVDDGQ